jgi:hypothetical protein
MSPLKSVVVRGTSESLGKYMHSTVSHIHIFGPHIGAHPRLGSREYYSRVAPSGYCGGREKR